MEGTRFYTALNEQAGVYRTAAKKKGQECLKIHSCPLEWLPLRCASGTAGTLPVCEQVSASGGRSRPGKKMAVAETVFLEPSRYSIFTPVKMLPESYSATTVV